MRGKMIVFDGGNGSGKTTIIRRIKEYLESKNEKVVTTREPGGTKLGEQIRYLVLSDSYNMCDTAELLLFAAARAQHIQEKIIPALDDGYHVLCDRFDSSTISFQQYARGIDKHLVEQTNSVALNGFTPDLYFILDLDPVIGLNRTKQRKEDDKFEQLNIEFLIRARNGYLKQAEQKDNFYVIDASQDIEYVINNIIDVLDNHIKLGEVE